MSISLLVLVVLGGLTGVTTVVFGFGGGFVTVPVVYAVSVATAGTEAMHVAVATSAAVMVVNSSIATIAQVRTGGLRKEYLHPLAAFIAAGAVVGAAAANAVSDRTLHLLFGAYLVVAIADIVLRRGFITNTGRREDRTESPGRITSMFGGIGIGTIAAFLGVGGSVLTVPLLRRKGLPMSEAAATANPLALPVAVVATLVYSLAAPADSGPGMLGHVNLNAAAALLCGALPTIAVIKRALVKVPDRLHAIAYPVFLTVVLITMTATAFA
ncbi:sulfite exporter TauE/SafE family protein [Nocardia sp. NPDC046473]|uniref:sulfite exporter TauE/SafE family protein n=1 Tax=Nocardia sp. NPDC046473 TaxID=3155733 RepID=UPI00340A197A